MDTTDPLVSDGGALMPRQCPFCGWFGVRAQRGAAIAFRVFPSLTLPRSISVPMCMHCGKHFLDPSKEVALTPTLNACYEARLRVMLADVRQDIRREPAHRVDVRLVPHEADEQEDGVVGIVRCDMVDRVPHPLVPVGHLHGVGASGSGDVDLAAHHENFLEGIRTGAKLNADIVVLGTHGRTGLKRLLIGSVAEKVVRLAGCPVLVVREKKHERPDDAQ